MPNNTKRLPDAYAKQIDSNNYKLLQLANLLYTDLRADLESIFESRDLQHATGKTLDRYGEMIGQARNGATDEQYRIKILGKIARRMSDGTCNSVINLVAQVVGESKENISIREDYLAVAVLGMTLETLENSGYTSSEITNIIEELIPVGVVLEPPIYKGSLLVMGNVSRIAENKVRSYDAYGNYQFPEQYGVELSYIIDRYPVLACAAHYGWFLHSHEQGRQELGVSGASERYTGWAIDLVYGGTTYNGGSLGILSGDDE